MLSPHLLFISERYPPDMGGVSASAGRISRAVTELGADVDVITWTRNAQTAVVANEPGNPAVYRMGRFREWDATMPHTLNLIDWLAERRAYDAVWGHYLAPAGFLATWVARMQGIASAVSIRGNDLDRDMFPPGDFARLLWTLRNADCVTAVTRQLARKAKALVDRDDVLYLPNAVDASVFRPLATSCEELRTKTGIRPGEAVLGFAGELREKKGLPYLIEALRRVQANRPACLLIIGEIRPSEMSRVIERTGPGSLADNRILVTGALASPEDVNAHLQLCDVYLQPSLWDGMPNALLEAMAAGCGCIASDAGGIPEIITSGEDGIVLPRWQLHRLDEAILEWLDADAAHRNTIRTAARARVLSAYGFDHERRGLEAVLERLLGN